MFLTSLDRWENQGLGDRGASQGYTAKQRYTRTLVWFLRPRSSWGLTWNICPWLPRTLSNLLAGRLLCICMPVGWFQNHQPQLLSQAEMSVFTGASGGVCMCHILLFHLVHGRRCISRAPTGWILADLRQLQANALPRDHAVAVDMEQVALFG